MEAHLQDVGLTSKTSSSTHALTFPTIDVSDKTVSLVSDPLNMRSKITKHAEEVSEALEESAYDLLDDATLLNPQDDTASTVSVTSFDDDTPDEGCSAQYDEDADNHHPRAPTPEQDDAQYEPVFEPSRSATGGDMTAQSDLTVRPGQSLTSSLVFHEPETTSTADKAVVTRTVHTLGEPHTSEARRAYGQRRLTVNIEQTMAQHGMSRDRPFRILYVGDASHRAKDQIICKLASALAATTDFNLSSSRVYSKGSARYTVITIPSFEDNNHQVELIDSSGIEILIDECTAAESTPHGVCLNINGEKLVLYDLNKTKRPIRPDLAIFFHSDQIPHWFSLVRPPMECLGLPCLDISEVPLFNANHGFKVDPTNLHMRINVPRTTEVLDRLPVDLATFLNVDAGQLNRHLAYITGPDNRRRLLSSHQHKSLISCTARHVAYWMAKIHGLSAGYIERVRNDGVYYLKECTNFRLPARHRTPFWLLLSTMLVFILSAMISYGMQSALTTSPSSPVVNTTAMTASKVPTSQLASGSILAGPAKAVPTLDMNKAVGQPLLSSNAIGVNDSSEFKIHILGDHVVLTPPKRFASLKKPPQLFLRVVRDQQAINASLEKLAEGAYAVTLERDQAYGNLNVSIWTRSKPVIAQDFTLKLGSPYLKLSTYKATAAKLSQVVREEANLVQSSIQKATTEVSTTLQAAGKQISHTADRIQDGIAQRKKASQKRIDESVIKAAAVRKAVGEHFMKSQASVHRQIKERMQKASNKMTHTARTVKSLSNRQFAAMSDVFRGARVANVLDKAPSVRRSKALLKARKNALGLLGKASKEGEPKPVEKAHDKKERMKKSCKRNAAGSRRKVHAKELC